MTLSMVVADVKRRCPRFLPRGVGGFLPRVEPQAVRDPKCESCPAPQRDPELRLVIARGIRHVVDVRPHEGQEGDAEGLQICQRLGVVLTFDKRF